MIDYSNMGDTEFSAKILDAFTEIQKMEKPENWEVLRPYAEKILAQTIPSTHDDAVISGYRTKLQEEFGRQKEATERLSAKAKGLFETLKCPNPYTHELSQVTALFAHDISSGNDIQMALYALKQAFGYKAFDDNQADKAEVDDLANRLKNYRDLQRFLEYETELRAIQSYCDTTLPELPQLAKTRKIQRKIVEKTANLQPYIDSEVKLKTELVGKIPPGPEESNTYGLLVKEYSTVYLALHDNVLDRAEGCRNKISEILNGDDLKAFKIMEKITALLPAVSDALEERLQLLADGVFGCPSPSKASVEERLRNNPVHHCNLSFENYAAILDEIDATAARAYGALNGTINGKLEVFINPAVRARLEQGKKEPIIAKLLDCKSVADVRNLLIKACLKDPAIVDIINRYLKRIVVKTVSLAEFVPSVSTIEKEQVGQLMTEFGTFLEKQFEDMEGDLEALPMLKLEGEKKHAAKLDNQ